MQNRSEAWLREYSLTWEIEKNNNERRWRKASKVYRNPSLPSLFSSFFVERKHEKTVKKPEKTIVWNKNQRGSLSRRGKGRRENERDHINFYRTRIIIDIYLRGKDSRKRRANNHNNSESWRSNILIYMHFQKGSKGAILSNLVKNITELYWFWLVGETTRLVSHGLHW